MTLRNIYIYFFCLVFISSAYLFADNKDYYSRRWRLKFENSAPATCIVKLPDGSQRKYWYVLYKVTNDMNRDIPWMINIKLVIDKVKRGVVEADVPEVFHKATIPASVIDKAKYLDSLETYYDTDLPLVKQQILHDLRLTSKLSNIEEKILATLKEKGLSSIMVLREATGLSYQELDEYLNKLVIKNLVISQETFGQCTFLGAKDRKTAQFMIFNEIRDLKVGDKINKWDLISFTPKRATLKQDDVEKTISTGMGVEYLYEATGKFMMKGEFTRESGMTARGTYKGKVTDGTKKYNFIRRMIPKNSSVEGLAIFSDVSPEMDFCAIVVSGLVDPIVRKDRKLYAEKEIFLNAYEQPGDAFNNNYTPIKPLYKKWIIIDRKEVNKPAPKPEKSIN